MPVGGIHMKNKKVLGICLVVLFVGCTWNAGYPKEQLDRAKEYKTDLNGWQPYMTLSPNDSMHVLRVSWGDSVKYCRAVFKNDRKRLYRLVAPWLEDVKIERPIGLDVAMEQVGVDSVRGGVSEK
jgi:hypothetical protein